MTVKRAGGAVAASAEDLDMTAWVPDDPIYTMNETAYRELPVPGGGATFRYKLWNAGDRKPLSEITAAFTADTVYPTPPAPPPIVITATVTGHAADSESFMAITTVISAVTPPRQVDMVILGFTRTYTTGTTNGDDVGLDAGFTDGPAGSVLLTDQLTGIHSTETDFTIDGLDAEVVLTITVPAA